MASPPRKPSLCSFQQVELVLHSLPPDGAAAHDQLEALAAVLRQFQADHEDAAASAGAALAGPVPRLDALIASLQRHDTQAHTGLVPALLRTVKILARRADMRKLCVARHVQALVSLCSTSKPAEVAAEAVNALLNLGYEAQNVTHLLAAKGEAALLKLLASGNGMPGFTGAPAVSTAQLQLQMVTAAALQTVSFQQDGRAALLQAGAIAVLLRELQLTSDLKLRQRIVGCLQNLSTEGRAILQIRQLGGISQLAAVLSLPDDDCLSAAAGALQNLSREEASRLVLLELPDVIQRLIALLASGKLQAAVSAVATLTNLMASCTDATIRQQAGAAMAGLLACGAVRDACYAAQL